MTDSIISPKTPSFDYDEICKNETMPTQFIEDPFICNRFIRCNHGLAQKFKCSINTAWDIERKLCLWVDSVNCGSRIYVSDFELLGENDPNEITRRNTTTRITTIAYTTNSTISKIKFERNSK